MTKLKYLYVTWMDGRTTEVIVGNLSVESITLKGSNATISYGADGYNVMNLNNANSWLVSESEVGWGDPEDD